MNFHYHVPEYPLRKFVKSIIYYEGYTCESNYETILPDGYPQLIIELDGNHRYASKDTTGKKDFRAFKNAWIKGLFTQPLTYLSEKNASTLSIQFEACSLSQFLRVSSSELTNNVFEADQVLGSGIPELREKLIELHTFNDKVKLVETYLMNSFASNNPRTGLVEHIVSQPNFSESNIRKLCKELGYSQKHMITMFRNSVGVTPKKIQILQSINKSIALLNAQPKFPAAQTAIETNHFDQSHFIRNFKLITSMTPRQYLKKSKIYPHVITFD